MAWWRSSPLPRPGSSGRCNVPRERAPDDWLREAIHSFVGWVERKRNPSPCQGGFRFALPTLLNAIRICPHSSPRSTFRAVKKIRHESQKANGSFCDREPYLARRGAEPFRVDTPRDGGILPLSSVSIERTKTRESSQYERNEHRSESRHREALCHVIPCSAGHF